jgi:hypothetical protein
MVVLARTNPPQADKSESSDYGTFWMPVEDPVFNGNQVRHDGIRTFYEFINIRWTIFNLWVYSAAFRNRAAIIANISDTFGSHSRGTYSFF